MSGIDESEWKSIEEKLIGRYGYFHRDLVSNIDFNTSANTSKDNSENSIRYDLHVKEGLDFSMEYWLNTEGKQEYFRQQGRYCIRRAQ